MAAAWVVVVRVEEVMVVVMVEAAMVVEVKVAAKVVEMAVVVAQGVAMGAERQDRAGFQRL